MKTYTIAKDGSAITCRRCGLTSYNRHDVLYRYCGSCHIFHEDFENYAMLLHDPEFYTIIQERVRRRVPE